MQIPLYVVSVMNRFPNSFINHNSELILIPKFNVYFSLVDVESPIDIKCKMCEWFSRDCCYSMRYSSDWRNEKYWKENTENFNAICGTDFKVEDMETIYQKLGNAIRHGLTEKFVNSGFDMSVLEVQDNG